MSNKSGLSETARYYLAQIRQTLEASRADLCSHGVKREACADHRSKTEETP